MGWIKTHWKYNHRRIREEEDDLSDAATEYVPDEVRDWLASTFTRAQSSMCTRETAPRFRSVANAIRAGIVVERLVFYVFFSHYL